MNIISNFNTLTFLDREYYGVPEDNPQYMALKISYGSKKAEVIAEFNKSIKHIMDFSEYLKSIDEYTPEICKKADILMSELIEFNKEKNKKISEIKRSFNRDYCTLSINMGSVEAKKKETADGGLLRELKRSSYKYRIYTDECNYDHTSIISSSRKIILENCDTLPDVNDFKGHGFLKLPSAATIFKFSANETIAVISRVVYCVYKQYTDNIDKIVDNGVSSFVINIKKVSPTADRKGGWFLDKILFCDSCPESSVNDNVFFPYLYGTNWREKYTPGQFAKILFNICVLSHVDIIAGSFHALKINIYTEADYDAIIDRIFVQNVGINQYETNIIDILQNPECTFINTILLEVINRPASIEEFPGISDTCIVHFDE